MVKEINLFDEEVEKSGVKPEYYQTILPGILDKMNESMKEKDVEVYARFQVKRVIEALLFAASDPLSFTKIREITNKIHQFRPRILREIIQELQEEYLSQQRSFRLEEIEEGYVLRSCEEYSPYIDLLFRNRKTEKISHAAGEVLAIIAYKGPITRPDIDAIRGVDSSGTLYSLLEKNLIESQGKLEAPGRPTLYGITKDFLRHFGLRDIKDLPKLINQGQNIEEEDRTDDNSSGGEGDPSD